MKTPVTITAVWLRAMGGAEHPRVEVLVEIDGVWRLAITEIPGNFSHIAEGNGAYRWPVDELTTTAGDPGERP